MFLEKCGKFFFSSMRPSFFFALLIIPIFAAGLFIFLENTQVQELEERFSAAARKEKTAFARNDRKERFLKRYSKFDPYFLNHKIEPLALLQNEKRKIASLLEHPAFPPNASLKNRLEFLNENTLSFVEENIRTNPSIKETDEKLRHPVEMDEQDLQNLLAQIEDIPVGKAIPVNDSPQILIKDFKLKKQKNALQSEVFEVEMDLLKREFIK